MWQSSHIMKKFLTLEKGPRPHFKSAWGRLWSNEEGPLFSFLQTSFGLWPYSWSKFLERNSSSIWHEFEATNVHKVALYVGILMCDSTTETFLTQEMEWVLKEVKKFREQGFSNQQFDKWLHKTIFWHHVWFLPFSSLLCCNFVTRCWSI